MYPGRTMVIHRRPSNELDFDNDRQHMRYRTHAGSVTNATRQDPAECQDRPTSHVMLATQPPHPEEDSRTEYRSRPLHTIADSRQGITNSLEMFALNLDRVFLQRATGAAGSL